MTKQELTQDSTQKESFEQSDEQINSHIIKLAEESIEISKAKIKTGHVKVTRKTQEHQEHINDVLTEERVEIERVTKNITVESMPEIREENGILIIPVVEEKIEVVRTLILKEELRINKVTKNTPFHEVVTLRSQTLSVERQEED